MLGTLVVRYAILCALLLQPLTRAVAQAGPAPTEAEGRAHFEAGRQAFSEGRFAAALEEFKQAYALTQRAPLLYDIGTCADRLRHDQEALDAFQLYLVKDPAPPNLAEIQGRIAVLRETLSRPAANGGATSEPEPQPSAAEPAAQPVAEAPADAAPAPSAEPPAPPVARETQASGPGAGPWVVIGVSAAVVVAGGVLLALTASRISKVENAKQGTTLAQVRGAHDSVPVLSTAGFILLGAGVAGAAAGLAWELLPSGEGEARASAQLSLQPGGVLVSGSF